MKKLAYEHLIDINKDILKMSKVYDKISYTGYDDYPIHKRKIRKLIECAPEVDIIDTATYYLKNIILLQPFPDANHRTALTAVELFLKKSGIGFEYDTRDSISLQKRLYKARFERYNTYEAVGVQVLNEERNKVYELCREFIWKNKV